VLKVTHCAVHGSPYDLIRAAYHLGNRHVPIELKPDHLKIEPDHVLADLLRAMHLIVNAVDEAFEPESGAYTAGGHAHSHAEASSAQSRLAAIPVASGPVPHVHGPGCGHSH
jgi:urease accessory protein